MSSTPNLPAQDRMSLFLVIFLQKSHFLDLSSCFFLQTPSFFPALPSCPREVPGSAFFHKKIPFFSVQMEPCFVQVGALILSTERFTTPLALNLTHEQDGCPCLELYVKMLLLIQKQSRTTL